MVSADQQDHPMTARPARKGRRSKFGNVRVTRVVGDCAVTMDSKAEAKYYDDLVIRARKGEVTMIDVHPSFPLSVGGKPIGKYKADFKFLERHYVDGVECWRWVVVDVKGVQTQAFRLKWKAAQALYPDNDWRLVPAKSVRRAA
jgi:hypothetical protein